MHFTCPTNTLAAGVKTCSPAISGRPKAPILGGVLVTTEDGSVSLRAFDYETDIVTTVDARINAPGTVLVSHRLLTQILSVAAAATVTLEQEDNRLTVTAGRATWRLPLMHDDAFPTRPVGVGALGEVAGELFRDAVDRVAVAAHDTPAVDLPLNVVHVGFGPDTLDLVATDKYRIHTARIPWTRKEEPGAPFVLVEASRLAAIARNLTDSPVQVGSDLNRLSLTDEHTTVTTSLAAAKDGKWVGWQNLFALNPDDLVSYRFDRAELLTAIKQAVTLTDVQAHDRGRHITLTITDTEALIRGASAYDGDSAIPCPVDGFTGSEALEWTANAEYLIQAVTAADTDTVQLAQRGPKHPVAVGPPDEPATQIVMPIRKVR